MKILENLFKVKTIITLATTGLFIYLAVKEILPIETSSMVIGMVFTYYFNKDKNKNESE
jgi:hypothetical protein